MWLNLVKWSVLVTYQYLYYCLSVCPKNLNLTYRDCHTYSLQQWTVAHAVWQYVYGPRQSVKTCRSVTILHIFYNLFTDSSSSSESSSDFSSIIDFEPSQIFTSRKRKRPVQFVESEDDNLEVKLCKYYCIVTCVAAWTCT